MYIVILVPVIINKRVNSRTNWGRRFIAKSDGGVYSTGMNVALISIVLKSDRRPSVVGRLLPTRLQSGLLRLPSPVLPVPPHVVLFTPNREISTHPSVPSVWAAADARIPTAAVASFRFHVDGSVSSTCLPSLRNTENAWVQYLYSANPVELGRLKMREWKMREQTAGVENVEVSPMDRQPENK